MTRRRGGFCRSVRFPHSRGPPALDEPTRLPWPEPAVNSRSNVTQQIPLTAEARAAERVFRGGTREIAPDLAYKRLVMVNVVFVGHSGAGDRGWVLIDAGLAGTAAAIKAAAAARFGPGARPSAIVLTHGHFDHVGALQELAAEWDVPVYAHALERPYLDGSASYPPGDPTVGGGLVAGLAGLYPTHPVDVSSRLETLPADGTIPVLPGWVWLHTPGHAPGHVSLWREADRTLIAGDAFVTTAQESIYRHSAADGRDARAAALLHDRLGQGTRLRRDAGGSAPAPRRHGTRSRHAGRRHAAGAGSPGQGFRPRRASAARDVPDRPRHRRRWLRLSAKSRSRLGKSVTGWRFPKSVLRGSKASPGHTGHPRWPPTGSGGHGGQITTAIRVRIARRSRR